MAERNFSIVSDFPGYRAREEATKLPPGTLVYPSKNVTTNTAGRIQKVPGYAVDGNESVFSDNGIQGWYDFDTRNDARRNIRSGFLSGDTSGSPTGDYFLGAELITNSGFTGNADDWTLGDGWSYNSNNAIFAP